jgi:hypothetical protein
MTTPPLSLDDLMGLVRTDCTAVESLDLVLEALKLAEMLGQLGDHLVSFYIDEARASGESWAAIGERLGVSRQVVQKRYTIRLGQVDPARPGFFDWMVNDGKLVIVRSQEEARRRQSDFIGTEHLLLALAHGCEQVGAKALERCGAAPQVLIAAINGRFGVPKGEPRAEKLPFGAKAKAVLQHSLRESMLLEHRYVGTGHLALGCLTVKEGCASEVLTNLGVSYDELRRAVIKLAPADPPLPA